MGLSMWEGVSRLHRVTHSTARGDGTASHGGNIKWDIRENALGHGPHVETLVDYDGDLFVGGNFSYAGPNEAASIAR